jgi:hypothetical protein
MRLVSGGKLMSAIHPLVIAGGAGLVTGLAAGFAVARAGDAAAAAHPDGSEADDGVRAAGGWATGLGIAAGIGSIAAVLAGQRELGLVLLGAGAGAWVGSSLAKRSFESKHGIGIDTALHDVLSTYDDNDDRRIDLNANKFWTGTETTRTVTHHSTDSNGYTTYYDEDVYSIERLATRADANRDGFAMDYELRAVIGSYDTDGNGRLQQVERDRYRREAGEQQLR